MFKMFKLLIVFPHSPHWQCIQFWLSRADLSEAADRQTERRKFQYALIISLDVVVKYGTQRKNDRKIRPRRRCRGVLCVCVFFPTPLTPSSCQLASPATAFAAGHTTPLNSSAAGGDGLTTHYPLGLHGEIKRGAKINCDR